MLSPPRGPGFGPRGLDGAGAAPCLGSASNPGRFVSNAGLAAGTAQQRPKEENRSSAGPGLQRSFPWVRVWGPIGPTRKSSRPQPTTHPWHMLTVEVHIVFVHIQVRNDGVEDGDGLRCVCAQRRGSLGGCSLLEGQEEREALGPASGCPTRACHTPVEPGLPKLNVCAVRPRGGPEARGRQAGSADLQHHRLADLPLPWGGRDKGGEQPSLTPGQPHLSLAWSLAGKHPS